MAPIGWILAGLAVLATVLGLGLWLNRRKSTAHLALRLAEAYRAEGRFEVARRLYAAVPDLDQKLEPAREGDRRAREGDTTPVVDPALVRAARRRLREERAEVAAHLRREGIGVDLPPLEGEAGPGREG